MARKNIIPSYDMLTDISPSMASTITSNVVNVQNMDKASIHVAWSGTSPVGTITVQSRNGVDDSWNDVSFGSAISVSGNSGDHQIIFNELPWTDIRFIYSASSGTGTLIASLTAKQVGG